VTLVASLVGFAASARAECASDAHLSTCFDADTFWPHAGPSYFDFVGGRTTTPRGSFALALVSTYVARPLVLVLPSADPQGAEVIALDHVTDTTLLFSFGITDRLDASFALPVVAYRSGSGISALTSQHTANLSRAALRDPRAGVALRLVGPAEGAAASERFGLAARLELGLPIGDESSFAGDASIVGIPGISGDVRVAPFIFGFELGARIRKTADLMGARVGSQLFGALALGGDVLARGRLGFFIEAMALPTFAEQRDLTLDPSTGDRVVAGTRPSLVPAEWHAAVRSADAIVEGVSLSLGAGTPLLFSGESGVTSPRYRLTLSIRYAPNATEAAAP
jgi:hypothetical protein